MNKEISLSLFISSSGKASRRKAAELVKSGKVTVNGMPEIQPGRKVSADDDIRLDGVRILPPARHTYVMLNKPRGYVSTNMDRFADKKAVDLITLPDAPRLFSAGRLDKESEGMMIFSDDGEYINRLSHPRYGICKRYEVLLERSISENEINQMLTGISDDGEILRVLKVVPQGDRCYILTLNEGKKREIRRMTAAVKAPTVKLKRISVGKLQLGDLGVGKFRILTPEEIELSLAAE